MPILLGIDVGSTSVKAVAVRSFYKRIEIAGVAIVELSAGVTEAEAIKTACATALGPKIPTADAVATSIDGAKAAVRTLTLPKSVEKQLGEVLPFELDSNLAFDISQSVFDMRVLPAPAGAAKPTIDVMVAVARIEDVKTRIDMVKGAIAAEPERIGVGPFPLAYVAAPLAVTGAGPICVLDLGKSTSELLVIEDGEPLFARALSLGTQGLPGTAQKLARELRVSIAAFRSQGGNQPKKIYLVGGGAFVSGAQAFLSSELECEVTPLPQPTIDVTSVPPELIADSDGRSLVPRFAKALGIALGLASKTPGFNLRRGPLAYERGFSWLREKTLVIAIMAALLFVSFAFSATAQLYSKGREKALYEAALGDVTKDVLGEETQSAQRANELLNAQTGANDEDPLPHADAFDVMVKLSEDIPQSMTHDIEELDLQKNHVVVHGIVQTVNDAQSIATSLKSERCMNDVKITRTNQVVGGQSQKYVLEFDVKCPEDEKKAKKKPGDSSGSASASAGGASSGSGGK
jgi:general secretion pathway protein L